MAERFKASVCGRKLAGVAGSNPAVGMDVCIVCCTVRAKDKAGTIRPKKYSASTEKKGIPGVCLL